MGWDTVFYPGIEGDKQKIQNLLSTMTAEYKSLFDIVETTRVQWNNILKFMTNTETKIVQLNYDFSKQIEPNIQNLSDHMDSLVAEMKASTSDTVPDVDKKIFDEIHKQLLDPQATFANIKATFDAASLTGAVAASIVAGVIGRAIYVSVAESLSVLTKTVLGAFGGAIVGLAFDMIWDAIQGAIEKKKLDGLLAKIREGMAQVQTDTNNFRDSCLKVILAMQKADISIQHLK